MTANKRYELRSSDHWHDAKITRFSTLDGALRNAVRFAEQHRNVPTSMTLRDIESKLCVYLSHDADDGFGLRWSVDLECCKSRPELSDWMRFPCVAAVCQQIESLCPESKVTA